MHYNKPKLQKLFFEVFKSLLLYSFILWPNVELVDLTVFLSNNFYILAPYFNKNIW